MYEAKPERRAAFDKLLADERVKKALDFIEADQERTKEELKKLVVIEAPSWHEEERAKVFASMLEAQGLEDVHIAEGGNVVSIRRGTEGGTKILLEGHMDTVFPFGTVKGVEERDGVLYAPGIGDDTRALAMLLCVDRALDYAGIKTVKDVLFVGTTREEGAGGLGGARDIHDTRNDIAAHIAVDNHDMGGICYQATMGETDEFIIRGKSGHAFGAFGILPNCIHAGAAAVARIAQYDAPSDPKTGYCTSNFHAGTDASVHAFAPEASIKINYRSNDWDEFVKLKNYIYESFEEAIKAENAKWPGDPLTLEIRTKNKPIPGGKQDDHMYLVEANQMSLEALGVKARLLKGGSTNANIGISRGIPSICLGRGYVPEGESGNIRNHSVDEFFPLYNAHKAVQNVLLVLLCAAGVDGLTEPME